LKKIDPTVIKETIYVASWTLILSVLLQAVYLIIGKWESAVLFGGLLGFFASVINFFLLGLTVQKAVNYEKADAQKLMKFSQSMRFLLLIGVAVLGGAIDCFNIVSVLVPMFFPRIAISFRPLFSKKQESKGDCSDKINPENREG